MVSTAFQSQEIISSIFRKRGKNFVKVKNPKTGTIREVRWYTNFDYGILKGSKIPLELPEEDFPLLIICGDRPEDREFLSESYPYQIGLGYYLTSSDKLPSAVPANLKFLILGYDEYCHYTTYASLAKHLAEREDFVKFCFT